VDQGLGEHGGGGGAVTGDVVGLGGDVLGQLGAQVLVRVVELDLAGDRDAVVGDGRCAELLVEETLRPRGPRVTLTVSASLSTPRSRARRASSLNLMILAMPDLSEDF